MTDLAERIEGAEGPSRELDALIEVERRKRAAFEAGLDDRARAHWRPDAFGYVESQGTRYPSPAYTASIDAAMTLVTEGWLFDLYNLNGYPEAHLTNDTLQRVSVSVDAATPALALCAAALRARKEPDQ